MPNEEEMKRIWGAFYGQLIGDALGVTCEFSNVEAKAIKMAEVQTKTGRNGNDSVFPMITLTSKMPNEEEMKRIWGAFYGQLIGDALGVTCEFSNVEAKAIKMAEIEITPNWSHEITEEQKKQVYKQVKKNVQGHNTQSLSNGALMRISSLAIAYRNFSTKELHAVATYCVALAALLKGKSITEAFDEAFESTETPMIQDFSQPFKTINKDAEHQGYIVYFVKIAKLHFDAIARGGDADTNRCIVGALIGARFGADNIPKDWIDTVAFQSAFYQLLHAKSFSSGLEDAIARGGDADTNRCIVGALIGARFGVHYIPKEWIDTVRTAEPCR
uniref:ADP-ribosylglycohydrolase n=1 Tax=Panagrolaimus sp. PS1159 TaxID=55785 RepID=A0AC35GXI8_9BILA